MGFSLSDLNPLARPSGGNANNIQLPNYQQNRDMISGYLGPNGQQRQGSGTGPYMGANPYQQDWRGLISQLQAGNPSLAANQYRQASQDSQASIGSMARASNRPGASRAAMAQQARVGQGMAAGSATAMMEEQASNRAQLGGALSGAGQADFQRDSSNQQAWMNLLGQQLGLDQQQLQAIIQREQMKQQQAMMPTMWERGLGVASQIGQFAAMPGVGQATRMVDSRGNGGVYGG